VNKASNTQLSNTSICFSSYIHFLFQ